MANSLDEITVKGFKSIRSLENFKLNNLNILIGGNGAGKSNFIDIFRLLRAMFQLSLPELSNASLKSYTNDAGGSDSILFNGPKVTECIEFEFYFGINAYKFKLFCKNGHSGWWEIGNGNLDPFILEDKNKSGVTGGKNVSHYIYENISAWKIYHLHDTGKFSPMKRNSDIEDNEYLRFNGSNIAPFLFFIRESHFDVYREIVETIKTVTPFFDDFILKPNSNNKIRLNWKQKGSDYPLSPNQLSDGTLRFIGLTTALLQPVPPSTIIIDEPELGLHPYAIEILAELIKSSAHKMQVIISTQSTSLVDYFEAEDLIIVNRKKPRGRF
jgi:predicted ATPase